jgi:hypothetical protein
MSGRDKENAYRFADARQSTLWIYVRAVPWSTNDSNQDLGVAMASERRKAMGLVTDEFQSASEDSAVPGESRHGLRVLGPSAEQLKSRRTAAHQLLRPIDGSSTFLVCHHEDIVELEAHAVGTEVRLIPHCEHYFANPQLNAVIKVHYRRSHLSEWRDIEQRVNSLLAGFATVTKRK